jgi:putative hemolysin
MGAAFTSAFERFVPFSLPRSLMGLAEMVLGFRALGSVYDDIRQTSAEQPIVTELLRRLAIVTRISEHDFGQIRRTGPVVIVVNHPTGILDGAVLVHLCSLIRGDTKILANELLSSVPELAELLIPVDVFGGKSATYKNAAAMRRSIEHLQSGGLLIAFPAGEVSHFQWNTRSVSDSSWSPSAGAIIRKAYERGVAVSVVPGHLSGGNSLLFHAAGAMNPSLRTLLIGRELINKRGRTVEVRFGSAIPVDKLASLDTDAERIDYLRWRTYLLASRNSYKPRTRLPFSRQSRSTRNMERIVEPMPAAHTAREIMNLDRQQCLATGGEFSTYVATAHQIPAVLREIGRLREITFRAAGEGTGRAIDLDQFDTHYRHLFVWHASKQEVVGAYRLACTDETLQLYTSTLFRYGSEFLEEIGPAVELGRSFIRPEYQKGFQPLLLLWKGIGEFIRRNPRYRVLFGAVSISNQYQALTRRMIVSFLERTVPCTARRGLVAARNPFRADGDRTGLDLEDLSAAVSDLEPGKPGIPVLLRQYLKLGGKLLAFHVDSQFSNVLDGLILVDLYKTDAKLLERYLGKDCPFLSRP